MADQITYYTIYKITNLVNGKMYIGKHKTKNLDDGYMGSGHLIKRALQKYGANNFRKEWLMFCEDEEEMNYMELVYVDETWVLRNDTYNLTLGGNGGLIEGQHSPRKGVHISEETRMKLRKANIGKKHSQETKKKMSISHKGKHFSQEHNEKIRNWHIGRKASQELRDKLSKAHIGKKLSMRTRRKLSEAQKARWENKKRA